MNIKMLILAVTLFASSFVFAGAKGDFIAAVMRDCKANYPTEEKAGSLATGGRQGTVIRYKTCTTETLKVAEDCTLNCSDSSSKIGK